VLPLRVAITHDIILPVDPAFPFDSFGLTIQAGRQEKAMPANLATSVLRSREAAVSGQEGEPALSRQEGGVGTSRLGRAAERGQVANGLGVYSGGTAGGRLSLHRPTS
jgi:hypothetical protein